MTTPKEQKQKILTEKGLEDLLFGRDSSKYELLPLIRPRELPHDWYAQPEDWYAQPEIGADIETYTGSPSHPEPLASPEKGI